MKILRERDWWINIKILFKNHWMFLIVMCLCKFTPGLFISLLNPYVSKILHSIEKAPILRGAALATHSLFATTTVMFFGHFSEWSLLGRNAIITAGIALIATSCLVSGFAEKWWHFVLLLALSGSGAAAAMCSTYSLIVEVITPELIPVALAFVELFEAIAWVIGPNIFGGLLETDRKLTYIFLAFSLCQFAAAVFICVALFFLLKPVRKKAIEGHSHDESTLKERLRILFTTVESYLVLTVNVTACFSFHAVSSTHSIYLGDENAWMVKWLYSVPASIPAVLSVPLLRRYVGKIQFVTFAIAAIAPLYFFHGDSIVNKFASGPKTYLGSMIAIIFIRDYLFWAMYVMTNLILMDALALKHPTIELKGLSSALYVLSFGCGDALGQLFGNIMFEKIGFNGVAFVCAGLCSLAFVVVVGLRFLMRKRQSV